MFWLKFLLATIFFFQLSTNVLTDSDLTEEAGNALHSLFLQIEASLRLIAIRIYDLWDAHMITTPGVTDELLKNETEKFNLVLGSIVIFASNVVGGEECLDSLVNMVSTIADPTIAENLIFSNLRSIATKEISNIKDQYMAIYNEFTTNCFSDSTNCEGTSKAVLAEVDRLLPKAKRIPLQLLTELYSLRYGTLINLESARTNLWEQYNKGVQNATICLAAKIRDNKQGKVLITPKISRDNNESLTDSYEDLVTIVTTAKSTSVTNLDSKVVDIAAQFINDITDTTDGFGAVFAQAELTVDFLINVVHDFNTTINCDPPDVLTIFTNSLQKFYIDSFPHLLDIMQRLHGKATKAIYDAAGEIESIGVEITDCPESIECDYVLEKIASRKIEIPLRIQKIENSTLVLFQQTVAVEGENGARAARVALEHAEVVILELKSCIQYSLE